MSKGAIRSTGGNEASDAKTLPLWIDQAAADEGRSDGTFEKRKPMPGDLDVDVAIVGGGYSGLWTAYYLSKLDPSIRIALLERYYCGYGASGRNGGWAVGEIAGSFNSYANRSSPADALRLTRTLFDAVDEIGRVVATEGIDCDFKRGGTITVARNTPQARRMRDDVAHEHKLGLTPDEYRLLDADEAKRIVNATNVQCGAFLDACAALHPARLARGLARTVDQSNVTIYEDTTVTNIATGRVDTERGTVRAPIVVQATEAYTRDLAGQRRDLLPVFSLMIATEPLPEEVFDEIGLAERPTFGDARHMVIYGQRTADNRLAFGGRGVPYLFGSKVEAAPDVQLEAHQVLYDTLVDLFPVIANYGVTHRWGGVLGIPRNWVPGLRLDRKTGRGVLGGYIGEGVLAAQLAGRTMADLVVGDETDRTSLPWVDVGSRRWEPEPLRWLGVRASRRVLAAADDHEEQTDREAAIAFKISRFLRGA